MFLVLIVFDWSLNNVLMFDNGCSSFTKLVENSGSDIDAGLIVCLI